MVHGRDVDRIVSEQCWRLARIERAGFIVDAERYYRAFRESVRRARHTVFILGWDIHSELRLVRDGSDDGWPETLRELLDAAAERNPDLDIYVLAWDFAMIYAMERELFPNYQLQWKSHDRVHFSMDAEHPMGASQHQKLVVVDDRIAFAGGIDLGKWRWDSSRHHPDDDRRVDPSGNPYPPFHDLQMVVEGEAASVLGELARDRWRRATESEAKAAASERVGDPWPPSIEPDVRHTRVGIARTMPAHEGRDEVREVEQLYLDSIRAARRFIYIENQYLSSHAIGKALAQRLEEDDGPEVVIVAPEQTGGWLEQHTMDVLRARLLRDLRRADQQNRLRAYFVRVSEDPHLSVMVHAKLMVVDDRLVRIGSSNLSNRSMGLDSECDLLIEAAAEGDDNAQAIRGLRRRLLAEHLDVDPSSVGEAEEASSSLIAAIESLRGGSRTLVPLDAKIPDEVDDWVPDSKLLDPEKPVEPDELMNYFVGEIDPETSSSRSGLIRFAVLGGLLLALGAVWRSTPLGDSVDVDNLTAGGEWLRSQPLTPLLVVGGYVLAGFAIVPVTLLFVATVMVFGPSMGAAYCIVGGELSALACFAAGHFLGRDTVRRLAGDRINAISGKLAERGILTMVTLRIVPVAPFSIVNLVAGVSEIRLRDFAIGNLIGMLPGIVAVAFVTDRALTSLRDPSWSTIAIAVGVAAVGALMLYAVRRLLRRKGEGR
jgi:phosphatidylserine/phosphatidylglycerophosphate/cardiolipin synthase-like enzyme/membrane protein DedA with SNARE-associated domain